MSTATVAYSRFTTYTTLPNILIQDPVEEIAFLLTADQLGRFETNAGTWSQMGLNTVTFTIPEEGLVEEVPPFARASSDRPDVLIQWKTAEKSYFLPYSKLSEFATPLGRSKGQGYDVSFALPRGTELIDELPALRRAILQSGEMAADY